MAVYTWLGIKAWNVTANGMFSAHNADDAQTRSKSLMFKHHCDRIELWLDDQCVHVYEESDGETPHNRGEWQLN
jgi:hypothetical protein